MHANDGFSTDEKELLRTEIERVDEFLAAQEDPAVGMAEACRLNSIQDVCDSRVVRHSITMAIRVRLNVNNPCIHLTTDSI